jgi:hypothetical protein
MNWTKISTQAELDAAIAKDGGWLDCQASFRFSLTKGSWRVRAAFGFKASVVAWENSSVEAWGNVFVRLFSALKIKASAHVAIMRHGPAKSLDGGRVLEANKPSTPADWCDHYGVAVENGVATLYKALDEDFSTDRARAKNISYAPGQTPAAPDWDGGVEECGGGLHASPHPKMALEFNSTAKRFAACPVKLEGISVHPDGYYPHKVKFSGCCAPCYEVDRNANPVATVEQA